MILGNFHGFLQNFQKKWKLEVPLAQKLKVVWKTLLDWKVLKYFEFWNALGLIWKKSFLAILGLKTSYWKNPFFFEFFSKNFKAQSKIRFTSAWKTFFSNFLKVETTSFYPLFLSSKNIYKWILKLNFCGVAFWCKTPQNRPNPETRNVFL